ncbi:MAG: indole-3-glycerol phosphate synthase TrpC [Pyrinomonadaceae bacterium]|nr:indole-3-glycerol phosphate synthase TrpC [Pyrinomonadaceae bacterium]
MFLTEIIELKKARLASLKRQRDLNEIKDAAFAARAGAEKHRFLNAIEHGGINIIAEFKRASPSKGIINDRLAPEAVAKNYKDGGACAISVLTEEDRFKGSLQDLKVIRNAVDLPVLRKDFIFDEYQIYEAAEAGADAILLIAAMLGDSDLRNFYSIAENLGLDALVEVHTKEELERVKKTEAKIIGVNNRDLHTFKVSLDVSRELIKHAPEKALMITESGITSKDEISELRELGFAGFLIGETLMRSGNAAAELGRLTT